MPWSTYRSSFTYAFVVTIKDALSTENGSKKIIAYDNGPKTVMQLSDYAHGGM